MKLAKNDEYDAFTITTKDMTRFFMTLDESVDLIQKAIEDGESGDTWIPILRSGKIMHLAQIFEDKFHKPIVEVGIRPGEKIHESLVNKVESMRVVKNGDFYVIKPSNYDKVNTKRFEYSSADDLLSKEELLSFLNEHKVFEGVNEM
jgi:UDP-glucose 4-epimerase